MIQDQIPMRLYTQEVLDIVGVGRGTWKKMQESGSAPCPRYRGKGGYVYLGADIARFLGLINDSAVECDNDPFMMGLHKLG